MTKRADLLTANGEPDEFGDRPAELTELGKRFLVSFLRRTYVQDAPESAIHYENVLEVFAKEPDGFAEHGDGLTVTEQSIVAAVRGAGFKIGDDGCIELRRRDPLGVRYGAIKVLPREDLIAGILPRASLGLVVGDSGVLKSWAVPSMAVAVAHGTPWLGRYRTPTYGARAVYCNFDMPLDTLETRLVELGDDGRVGRCNFPDLSPADPAYFPALKLAGTPELAIIDTLGGATPGVSERDATFSLPLKLARRYANEVNGSVIFVHHSGKEINGPKTIASVVRGTSALGADVDVLYHLESVKAAGPKERRARMTCLKFRASADLPPPITLQLVDGKLGILGAVESFADEVLSALRADPGVSGSALAKTLHRTKTTVLDAVDELVEAGKVRVEGKGRTTSLYPVNV